MQINSVHHYAALTPVMKIGFAMIILSLPSLKEKEVWFS